LFTKQELRLQKPINQKRLQLRLKPNLKNKVGKK